MSDMHVLLIPSWYYNPQGGSTTTVRDQARHLSRRGLQVGVIYPEITAPRDLGLRNLRGSFFDFKEDDLEGVNSLRLSCTRFPTFNTELLIKRSKDLEVLYYKILFKKYCETYGCPDLIHAHDSMWGGLAAKEISEKYEIPFILTQHRPSVHDSSQVDEGWSRDSLLDSWQVENIKKTLKSADQVIAVSESLKKSLSSFVDSEEISVVNNMVETEGHNPRSSEKIVFLSVARHEERKNLSSLIKSFRKLDEDKTELRLASSGSQTRRLQELAGEDLGEKIKFLDWLSQTELEKEIASADYTVLTSHAECFPMSNLESISLGTPVITTSYGGASEMIDDDNGIMIESSSEGDIYDALRKAVDLVDTFDRSIVKETSKDYLPRNIAAELNSLYESQMEDIGS